MGHTRTHQDTSGQLWLSGWEQQHQDTLPIRGVSRCGVLPTVPTPGQETREQRIQRILRQCKGKVCRASQRFDYERATRIAKQLT